MSKRKNSLFEEAIADAQQIKKTALANAKMSLAETFSPTIQSMITNKLNEAEEMDDEIIEDDEVIVDDELGLSNEMEDGEIDDDIPIEDLEDDSNEEEAVVDLTIDEFRELVKDVLLDIESESSMDTDDILGDEIPLETEDEIVDDIVSDDEISIEDEDENLDELNENQTPENEVNGLIGMIKNIVSKTPQAVEKIKAFLEEWGEGAGRALRNEELETQLNEANKKISQLNLLNSKLIYVNKIFKATNLTESKKVAVINAFDRASSIKEVKNTFTTLKESSILSNKPVLKENKGSASAAMGIRKPEVILENKNVDEFVERMKKLAGIKN